MNYTPEIEAILADLTDLCCTALRPDSELEQSRVDELAKSLSANGWKRHSKDTGPLSDVLKARIKDRCKEPAMHRGAAIDGLVATVQHAYENASRMEASGPDNKPPQAMPPRNTA
jgi:hypothetical protein